MGELNRRFRGRIKPPIYLRAGNALLFPLRFIREEIPVALGIKQWGRYVAAASILTVLIAPPPTPVNFPRPRRFC